MYQLICELFNKNLTKLLGKIVHFYAIHKVFIRIDIPLKAVYIFYGECFIFGALPLTK